ncbi:hypothetical protein PHYSODRAFT_525846 [Phytophthora sojae]|uniref:Uncharacterized protein n=1 Tax=Phytophthora sojae (strain P6497) TaxID=1094619 RepID=G5A5M8_PHYSP|nr:hypothetical protein PHYSODRAFT_525846 [Phytophthora sojae]EGZ08633.1 hypothetical protein PHYSODRAFT_525846 [Phytophthora sojae]|eukprot:XP_009535266.1 hypothetical protein PHYSODRAFT_525846 [Phytophthora sojae]
MAVLEKLSSSLSSVFAETDRVFRLNGLNQITYPFFKRNTQPVSAQSTYVELLKCSLIPFDYRSVAEGFFGKMTTGCGQSEADHADVSRFCGEILISIATNVILSIEYRYAGIRYSEHKREVIVLAGQNQLMEALGVALDGVGFNEKSWCVMTEAAAGLCFMQLCIGVTVECKYVAPDRRDFVDRLCAMLAHLKQEVVDSVQREVEHDLIVRNMLGRVFQYTVMYTPREGILITSNSRKPWHRY